jgi:hypothetical protein
MSESKVAIAKLQVIQKLWAELGRVGLKTPEYETLLKKIPVLSAEYQSPLNPNESLAGKSKRAPVSSIFFS